MATSMGMNIIRSVFATIDKAIYGLITILYDLLLQLAETDIFKGQTIQDFSARIYAFLGIIMLFKVTFSLIEYLVNPDSMNDKTKGTGNLAKNVIITLFLIIIVPFGFDLLYSAQSAILKDNLIPKLILGTTNDSSDDMKILMDEKQCVTSDGENGVYSYVESNGEYIALMTLRPFYQIYDGKTLDENTRNIFCSAKSIDRLLLEDIYNAKTSSFNGEYIVDYSFFMSTACGILVMLLLLEFCFDVAMRSIKLGFLEIFAPVAIISYIDPKSSQNGMFKKWLKEVVGTWARLFIRLTILFFAIFVIKIVNDNQEKYTENSMWVMLFLIIGALLFAKKAVPLIEDLLGVKMDHSIQLNPFKKISDQAIGGKTISGTATAIGAGTVGAIGGTIAGVYAGSQVGSVGRGALIGAFSGFSNGKADKKHALTSGMNKTYKNMTGNEMSTLTPSKVILGMGNKGKESVKEIKGHIATAKDRLVEAQTNLNSASYTNAMNRQKINEFKSKFEKSEFIDVENIDASEAKVNTEITSLTNEVNLKQQQYNQLKSNYESEKSKYEDYKSFVDSYDPTILGSDGNPMYRQEFEMKKAAVEKYESGELDNLRQKVDLAQLDYKNTTDKLEKTKVIKDSINEYKGLIEAGEQFKKDEIEYRAQISKIEREISTLSDEKKQREQFWQVDSSPKTSLDEAIKNNPKKEKNVQNQQNNNSNQAMNNRNQ